MKPTQVRLLATVAAVSGILGWSMTRLADSVAGRYLPVTWTAAGAIWLLALFLLMWTWIVRPRLLRRKGTAPLSPHVAARTTALSLASSRTGAAVAGVYAGVVVAFLGELAAPAAQDSAIAAGVASIGGFALAAVGLWLESMCRVDDDDGDLDDHGQAVRGTAPQGE